MCCTHSHHMATHHETKIFCETADKIHKSWPVAGRSRQHQALWSAIETIYIRFIRLPRVFSLNACWMYVTQRECVGITCFKQTDSCSSDDLLCILLWRQYRIYCWAIEAKFGLCILPSNTFFIVLITLTFAQLDLSPRINMFFFYYGAVCIYIYIAQERNWKLDQPKKTEKSNFTWFILMSSVQLEIIPPFLTDL